MSEFETYVHVGRELSVEVEMVNLEMIMKIRERNDEFSKDECTKKQEKRKITIKTANERFENLKLYFYNP